MSVLAWEQPIPNIHVLLYHAVVSHRPAGLGRRERKYWMDAADFRFHIKVLENSRHPVASLDACWRARPSMPLVPPLLRSPEPAPVVLTFDDGWESNYSVVWPLLAAAGLPATFFVNTSTLGKTGHLRWSEVRRMSEEGASFGSHGHRHIALTRLRAQALDTELRMSKDLLEGWVRKPVEFLAVPYGCVSRRVLDAAFGAGYQAVCTSAPQSAVPRAETISRIAIHAGTSPADLARLIGGSRRSYWARGARAALLAPAKLLLGQRARKREFSPESVR